LSVDFGRKYGTFNPPILRFPRPTTDDLIFRNIIHRDPDPPHISTSYVERQNLSMRMGIRRFTRLTNAFSKKLENHVHALSIYFMHYNFVRIHQTLRCTPAMEAGVTDRLWSLEDMVEIVGEWEAAKKEDTRTNWS